MKKITLLFICMWMIAIGSSFATVVPTAIIQDSISTSRTLTPDSQYLLKGWVYVTSGAVLTIKPGVIIRGDKATKAALIVERGAKIYINGTLDSPVVMTSNQTPGNRDYGDWGGLMICGKAPNNWNGGDQVVEGGPRSHYGGTDPHDNSGKISYLRIEFAGIAFSPNNEVNGLTLCSVGDGTQIDHVFVGQSGDDGIEFFGGTVNIKYAVCYRSWDDDFDQDNGFRGKVQFGVVVRDPLAADASGSKAFEADSYQSGTATGLGGDTTKLTRPIFSNMTIIGPVIGNPGYTGANSNFVAGIHLRRGNATSLVNSVVAGWPCGVLIDESSSSFGSTVANIGNGALQIRRTVIEGTATSTFKKDVMFVKDGARSLTSTAANNDTTSAGTDWSTLSGYAGPWAWLFAPVNGNQWYLTEGNGTRLFNPWNLNKPNLVGTSTSPLCYTAKAGKTFDPTKTLDTNAATYNAPDFFPDFINTKASDPWFEKVNYIGALPCNYNWLVEGWINFNEQNTDYTQNISSTGVAPVISNPLSATVYPNPATTKSYVIFNMIQSGNVNISLLNLEGKVVKEIFNGERSANTYKDIIDLSNVAAGTYFVNISTQFAQKTIQLAVTK